MRKMMYRLAAAMAIALAAGCASKNVAVPAEGEGGDECGMHRNTYGQFELSDGAFKMTCEKTGDAAFRIVSITNLREDVTTVELRQFGNAIFHNLISPKLQNGGDLTPADEDILYFNRTGKAALGKEDGLLERYWHFLDVVGERQPILLYDRKFVSHCSTSFHTSRWRL